MEYTAFCTSSADELTQCRLNSLFASDTQTPVLYNLRYVPPYQAYGEIKKIQLRMHKAAKMSPLNTLVVNLSEWGVHLEEEYFSITLKFLHDFADQYRPSFLLCRDPTEKLVQKTQVLLSCYFSLTYSKDRCFEDPVETQKYLNSCCDWEPEALKLMTRCVTHPQFPKRYLILDRLIEELAEHGGGTITLHTLQQVRNAPTTPITVPLLQSITKIEHAM